MRSGDDYSELSELGSSYVGVGAATGRYDSIDHQNSRSIQSAGARSGLYYSPPGTTYTILERPSSVIQQQHQHHQRYKDSGGTQSHYGSPRGSSPVHHGNMMGKRAISPEQVLRMFNSTSTSGAAAASTSRSSGHHYPISGLTNSSAYPKGVGSASAERLMRRSPSSASSPPSVSHYYHHRHQYHPPNLHELTTRTITMSWDPEEGTHGFGICVKGGKDFGKHPPGVGVYISRVEEGSVAERAGLRAGDSILEVNGTPFTGVSHEDALKMLKSCKKLSMTVRSPTPNFGVSSSGSGSGSSWIPPVARQQSSSTCSWMDRYGRPVSPPFEYATNNTRLGSTGTNRYEQGRTSSKDRSIRKVELSIDPGQSLGLMIRGGIEYRLGIFITGVDKDSVADRAGLMIGDQILEVNGQSFYDVTHDEAVVQLKYHKRMSLIVKDVGKVPHSCTTPYTADPGGGQWDLYSPGSKIAQSTRKWAAALQIVEEKARCLLSRPEFNTLCYYTDEYASKHMTIDAFVDVITELLNTPEKYTLMTELREIVAHDDRARFDEFVFRKDIEANRIARDPIRDHNYRHSRRKGMVNSNHSSIYYPSNYAAYSSGGEEDALLTPTDGVRRLSSPCGESIDEDISNAGLNQQEYSDSDQDLDNKVSRSYDVKNDLMLSDGDGEIVGDETARRHHQSLGKRLGGKDGGQEARVQQDEEGHLKVSVKKTKPILGIAIEGGANTKQPLPRIININENGAAYNAGGLEVGQLILQVDGTKVSGLEHQDVARLIAESFARRDRVDIEFVVTEAKKSNLEPKPTAFVFLEA